MGVRACVCGWVGGCEREGEIGRSGNKAVLAVLVHRCTHVCVV